jgi:hypothetical protein
MSHVQCPVCFAPLEVREVAPCFICGGWPEMVTQFDPRVSFREWRMPSGEVLVLCQACELEEFMVPGWGNKLGLTTYPFPINELQPVPSVESPTIGKDKFCPQCNLRLAFLKIVAKCHTQS